MEEFRDTTERNTFPETERGRLIPLASLVLVTSAYFFRWGGEGLRSVWSAIFFFSSFAYSLAIIYKPSLIKRIRNTLVSTGIITVLFGSFVLATAAILFHITGEFIPSWLVFGFEVGITLVWMGILTFAPSFCILFYQNEFTPHSSNGLIATVRRNTTASLLWALFLGIILYGTYGNIKYIIWRSETLVNLILNLMTPSNEWITVFSFSVNLFINVTSALPAVILCAYLLVTVLINSEKSFAFVMAASYLLAALNPWHIIEAPEASVRISLIAGPALNSVVIVLAVWLLVRMRRSKKLFFVGWVKRSATHR